MSDEVARPKGPSDAEGVRLNRAAQDSPSEASGVRSKRAAQDSLSEVSGARSLSETSGARLHRGVRDSPSESSGARSHRGDAQEGPSLPRCPHCGKDHPPHVLKCPDTDLVLPLEGRVLHEKFRFVRQLGRGGMAAVWAAVNTLVERRVAIKLIRPEAGRSEETVARFRAEAKAAGRIGHPNVCEILDFGLGPLGPYIVMERLRGKSLGQLVRDEERLEPALAVGIMRQALAGLEAAHRRGIIHRDLKPENVFIHQPEVGPPVVKIMDFGVSKFTDGSSEVETAHGALLGTPEYMSPEQYRGAARSDARTDVWAVGAILYKVLTGKTAFGGGSVPGTLLLVTSEEPTPIPELVRGVPPELVAIVERCLRKEPDERFQTAQALSDALEPLDIDDLSALVVDTDEPSEEAPSPPTISVRSQLDRDEASSRQDVESSRIGADTLPPSTRHHRILADEARRPARPERRAWLLIAGVTIIGAGVLVALTRGSNGRDEQALAIAPAIEHPSPAAASESGPAETSEREAAAPAADANPSPEGTTGAPEPVPSDGADPPAATTGGPTPVPGADVGGATAEPTSGDEAPLGDEPTTGIPEDAGDEGDAVGDAGDDGQARAADPAPPPPTPPGTIRVGAYLTLAKPGPSSTHADARAYCRNLGKHAFVGVKNWTLSPPHIARRLAAHVKRGKYWTTALWKGKALVLDLPSQTKSSLSEKKKGPRALCVAKWP